MLFVQVFIASPALQLLAPLTSLIFRRIARGRGCAAGSGAPGAPVCGQGARTREARPGARGGDAHGRLAAGGWRARDPRRVGARVAGPGGLTTGGMRGRAGAVLRVRLAGAVCVGRLQAPGPSAGDSPGSAARGRLLAVCCAVTPGSAGQAARRRRPGSIEGASRHGRPAPVISKDDLENAGQSTSMRCGLCP